MPTMLNLFTFRSVYQTQDSIQVDAIRVTPFSNNFFYWEGDRVPKLTVSSLMLEANPKRNEDLKVIDWFSDAYLTGKTCTIDNQEAFCIFDLRYGQPINSAQSVWGTYYLPNEDGYLKKIPRDSMRRLTMFNDAFEMTMGTYPNKKVLTY